MKELFKSTTNTITVMVVLGTFLLVAYVIIMGVSEINTLAFGAWTTLIGWVVGAKSSKSKYQAEESKQQQEELVELPAEIKSIMENE